MIDDQGKFFAPQRRPLGALALLAATLFCSPLALAEEILTSR